MLLMLVKGKKMGMSQFQSVFVLWSEQIFIARLLLLLHEKIQDLEEFATFF